VVTCSDAQAGWARAGSAVLKAAPPVSVCVRRANRSAMSLRLRRCGRRRRHTVRLTGGPPHRSSSAGDLPAAVTNESTISEGRRAAARGLVGSEQCRGGEVFGGDRLGEGGLDRPVGTRCRVHLVDRGETLSGKTVGDTHKSWPDSAVDQGDFSSTRRVAITSGESRTLGEYGEDLMT